MQTEQAGQSVGRDHAIDGERACTFDKNQQREDKQGEGLCPESEDAQSARLD